MRKDITLAAITGLALLAIPAKGEDKIDFATQIYPFVKKSCVKCHSPAYEDERGRTRKPKADMVITDPESFMKGGEDGEIIVPGKPAESTFYTRTKLDMSDDDHMPPEDKAPELTDAQKELLSKWIEQGADFGEWKGDENPREGLE